MISRITLYYPGANNPTQRRRIRVGTIYRKVSVPRYRQRGSNFTSFISTEPNNVRGSSLFLHFYIFLLGSSHANHKKYKVLWHAKYIQANMITGTMEADSNELVFILPLNRDITKNNIGHSMSYYRQPIHFCGYHWLDMFAFTCLYLCVYDEILKHISAMVSFHIDVFFIVIFIENSGSIDWPYIKSSSADFLLLFNYRCEKTIRCQVPTQLGSKICSV